MKLLAILEKLTMLKFSGTGEKDDQILDGKRYHQSFVIKF